MRKGFFERAKKSWAFALAAASLPISYIFLFPCFGGACAGCPTGGVCLLAAPILIILVVAAKFFVKIKKIIMEVSKLITPKA
jgi:hypothetical protein